MDSPNKAGPPPPRVANQRSPGVRSTQETDDGKTQQQGVADSNQTKPASVALNGQWKLREAPSEPPPKEIPVPDVAPKKASGSPSPQVMMIRNMALEMASQPKAISETAPPRFYQRLENFYLKELLDSSAPLESPERKRLGEAAVKKIGARFEGVPTPGDYWETGAANAWKVKKIPEAAQALLEGVPPEIEGATHVLSIANRAELPILDGPFLVGKPNYDLSDDADVLHGGQNISHLLHWATGLKYAHVEPAKLRALFLLYELWHLEGWDVFGEDPVNDLISEEQGRLLGRLLLEGKINKENLREKLSETFLDARIWVGELLAKRQGEFDHFLNSATHPQSNVWWGTRKEAQVWTGPTLKAQLASGKTLDEVKQSDFAQRIAAIYSLIYEAKSQGSFFGGLSPLEKDLASGNFNETMWKVLHSQPLSSENKMKALWSLRPSIFSLP